MPPDFHRAGTPSPTITRRSHFQWDSRGEALPTPHIGLTGIQTAPAQRRPIVQTKSTKHLLSIKTMETPTGKKPMLESLITSQTRIKLLTKFFLNANTTAYLRGLAEEFGESSNAIRVELNRFGKAELLTSFHSGNKKIYRANTAHPLFPDIHNIILKHLAIDKLVEQLVQHSGNLREAWLTGDFARGTETPVIDVTLIGTAFNRDSLFGLITNAEKLMKRKIRYITLSMDEKEPYLTNQKSALLIWKA